MAAERRAVFLLLPDIAGPIEVEHETDGLPAFRRGDAAQRTDEHGAGTRGGAVPARHMRPERTDIQKDLPEGTDEKKQPARYVHCSLLKDSNVRSDRQATRPSGTT